MDNVDHDQSLTAQCVSSVSVPPTSVSWSVSGGDHGVLSSEEVHSASGGFITVSTLSLPAQGRENTNVMVRCEASYKSEVILSQTKSVSINSKIIFSNI